MSRKNINLCRTEGCKEPVVPVDGKRIRCAACEATAARTEGIHDDRATPAAFIAFRAGRVEELARRAATNQPLFGGR